MTLDREQDHAYLFKHVATQEVAYESLPFAVRSMLHGKVGEFIEAADPDGVDRQLDLLAHHFWHSDDEDRKRRYLERAADAARAAYANKAAIDYLERLVTVLDDADRVAVLLKLGRLQEFVGGWATSQATNQAALDLATQVGDTASQGWALHALADAARKQGRFDEAALRLTEAERRFTAIADEAGIAQVLHTAGTLASQQGDSDTAQERYETSAEIRERIGDLVALAATLQNLGVAAEFRGDYAAARQYNQRALAIRQGRDDRWGVGTSSNNLAMIALHEERMDEARELGESAVGALREVGDAWMLAIARNTLGNAARAQGDRAAAAANYASALETYRELDDRWAMAYLFEDVAVFGASTEPELAHELVGAADRLRQETGSPRGPALDAELARLLSPARTSIGDPAADAAVVRGRDRSLEEAAELAARLCGVAS